VIAVVLDAGAVIGFGCCLALVALAVAAAAGDALWKRYQR